MLYILHTFYPLPKRQYSRGSDVERARAASRSSSSPKAPAAGIYEGYGGCG